MPTRVTKLSPDTWKTIQFGAGVLLVDTRWVELSDYDKLMTAEYANILGATTGGVNIKVTPNFIESSLGGRNNVCELSVIRNYSITLTGKLATINQSTMQLFLTAKEQKKLVDIDKDAEKVWYRFQFNHSSPAPVNIWWIGNYGNDTSGEKEGLLAIHMRDTLSKGGFSLQTTHAAKGEFDFSFEAMYTVDDVNSKNMPVEVYFDTELPARFVKLSPDTWQTIQFGAGALLVDTDDVELSDYEKLTTAQDANILGATTGGVNIRVTPNFIESSLGGRNNICELFMIRNYSINITGKLVTMNQDVLQLLVGSEKIVKTSDASFPRPVNIWWVGNYGNDTDEEAQGLLAIHMRNVLSKGGFSLQTTHSAKGEFDFSFEAMYTIDDVNSGNMPFEMYFHQSYWCFWVKKKDRSGWIPFLVRTSRDDQVGVYYKVLPGSIGEELRIPIFS